MLSAFAFTKWGVKHGNVIYKFVLITPTSFHFSILKYLKLKTLKDNYFSLRRSCQASYGYCRPSQGRPSLALSLTRNELACSLLNGTGLACRPH